MSSVLPATLPSDQTARDDIRERLDATILVEAAAGTGKTTELVRRVIAVLAAGETSIDRLVVVTFTEKAAGELRLRLRSELEARRRECPEGSPVRDSLDHALAHLEEAHVNTIHGFCADLLRERPIEAVVDPAFRILPEPEAERWFAAIFDRWLARTLTSPPPGIARALRRPTGGSGSGAAERLRSAAWTLVQWRDFPAAWTQENWDREAAIDRLVGQLAQFAALTARCGNPDFDGLYRTTERARWLADGIAAREQAAPRDADQIEAFLVALAQDRSLGEWPGSRHDYGPDLPRAEVLSALAELRHELQAFVRGADADLAARLREELREPIERYEAAKARQGCLDFLDLLRRARDLVRDRTDLRQAWQSRFSHVFVDEFHDTDPLQAEILLLLTAADPQVADWRQAVPTPGRLFVVGDPKQSIYRFRRADVGLYLDVKRRLLESGARGVALQTSFRQRPSIQTFVNQAFAAAMDGDESVLQATYVPLSPFRDESVEQPSVIALPVPRPYGRQRLTRTAIEQSQPEAVAAFLDWLLKRSGWTVSERERPNERVPVEARHVCLLFRRLQSFGEDVTRPYVRALEARGIRHLLVGGRSFHRREEIESLRAALRAVEWPDDELAVYATLHGSLFAIGDEELLEYRRTCGPLHPFRSPTAGAREALPFRLQPIVEALQFLGGTHRRRNEVPIAETLASILEHTRAAAGFALRPSGEQVLANVLHLGELARAWEAEGGLSFRGFVERLEEEAESGQVAEAPILEEGSEGVRLMSVHRAKGLEFPVVLLADITAHASPRRADRHLDAERGLCAQRIAGWAPADLLAQEEREKARDAAEGVRVAYVAATRARDLLVVPAVGDEPWTDGWVSVLNDALYPAPDRRGQPEEATGCPLFGSRSVCERPDGFVLKQPSVVPGAHRIGANTVVWWDPHVLDLDAKAAFGLRRSDLIGKQGKEGVVEEEAERFERWRQEGERLRREAAAPGLVTQRVVDRATVPASVPGTVDVNLVELPRQPGRPGGRRFGTLVHEMLATVSFRASGEAVERLARQRARALGATEDEQAAAVEVVERALAHPIFDRARRASADGLCRRELPVLWQGPEGQMLDGVIDLAFREGGRWFVVEYKTDRIEGESYAAYRRQAALYAAGLAAATGERTSAILLQL